MASKKLINKRIENESKKLKNIIVLLHGRYIIFKQLFRKSKKRAKLLNKSGSFCLQAFQDSLLHEIILTICKLSDPPKSMGKDNLCVETIFNTVKTLNNKKLEKKLNSKLSDLRKNFQPLKTYRNKLLTHYDYATIMESNNKLKITNSKPSIKAVTLPDIDKILKDIRNFMNTIHVYLDETHVAYEDVILPNDGDMFIYLLKQANRYEGLVNKNKIDGNDLMNSKYYGA